VIEFGGGDRGRNRAPNTIPLSPRSSPPFAVAWTARMECLGAGSAGRAFVRMAVGYILKEPKIQMGIPVRSSHREFKEAQ
jgi:hypothetical protein